MCPYPKPFHIKLRFNTTPIKVKVFFAVLRVFHAVEVRDSDPINYVQAVTHEVYLLLLLFYNTWISFPTETTLIQ